MNKPPLPQRSFSAVLTRRYALFMLTFGLLIWLMALAERAGLPRSWIGVSFLVGIVFSKIFLR